MEKFLIDYEIDKGKEPPEKDQEGQEEKEGREDQERAEKARKAQNRYNRTWQGKEYEQINVKLPRGLKRAFLAACKERGISGRQYLIDSMRKIVDEEIGKFDL
jgi:CRISPR/Cas system CSM-associated protein Csm4 (group 5 of RAMP superfamily)